MFLLVRSTKKLELQKLSAVIKKYVKNLELQRFDNYKEGIEAIFNTEALNENSLDAITKELKGLDSGAEISFSENKGWFN